MGGGEKEHLYRMIHLFWYRGCTFHTTSTTSIRVYSGVPVVKSAATLPHAVASEYAEGARSVSSLPP